MKLICDLPANQGQEKNMCKCMCVIFLSLSYKVVIAPPAPPPPPLQPAKLIWLPARHNQWCHSAEAWAAVHS
jgi:hypothetical protein